MNGRHLLYDAWTERTECLCGVPAWRALLVQAATAAGATVVGTQFKAFEGGGLTGVVLLAESHLSVHTWPEEGFVALDCFTCGHMDPHLIVERVRRYLEPTQEAVSVVRRGHPEGLRTPSRS